MMAPGILVDTGFLVALGIRRDPRHDAARTWLAGNREILLVPVPVVVETCFFLSAAGKQHLLAWVRQEGVRLLEVPGSAYPEISACLGRYADRDPDFTDCALLWAAHNTGCWRVLTVDRTDFEVYRLKGKRGFELVDWEEFKPGCVPAPSGKQA
jgi:predicted nucleic acid-binding protein